MVDPTGYTALDLIGFTDKGDYNPLSTYLKNDLANFNGTKWRCKVDDTTGVTPSEGLTWTAFMVLPTDHTMDMIAPIETSPSANAYVTGKQLIFNEVLYDVIDDIAIGDTLEVGVNINTSDTIVEQIEDANGAIQQLTENIAPVEGATSLHAYVVGEQLIYNDTLYKVIAPIAVNDALVVDTNIEVSPKTVIEQVEDNASDISDLNDEFHDAWQKNGAYNIAPRTLGNVTTQGVTYTINPENNIVTATWSSTPTGNAVVAYCGNILTSHLTAGQTYKLTGCPAGGSWFPNPRKYRLYVYDETTSADACVDFGNGATFTPQSDHKYSIWIVIGTDAGASGSLTFKPMITADLNATYADFVPYAMTNRELTEDATIKELPITLETGLSYHTDSKSNYMVSGVKSIKSVVKGITANASTWVTIGVVDSAYTPKAHSTGTARRNGTTDILDCNIYSSGHIVVRDNSNAIGSADLIILDITYI